MVVLTSVGRLLSDPDQQAKGYLSWLTGTSGYYYTAFVHKYTKLTPREVTYVEKLLISDIREFYNTQAQGYYLEEIETSYTNFSKTVSYYVKQSIIVKGRATISVLQVGDSYTATLVYATRSKYGADAGQPNTFRTREPNLSLHKDRAKQKLKRRKKNRKMRKAVKLRKYEIEFNKVHTSNARRAKRSSSRTRGRS